MGWLAAAVHDSRGGPLHSPPLDLVQRFLLRTQDVADVDRQQLQREILGILQQHGEWQENAAWWGFA